MGAVDEAYGERFSHASVSRWEAGSTRPTVERLRSFGKALSLSQTELAGLILMAGLAPDFETASQLAAGEGGELPAYRKTDSERVSVAGSIGSNAARPTNGNATGVLRILFRLLIIRCLPLGMFIVATAYALSFLNWDDTWVPAVYVGPVVCVVVAQGFLFPDRSADLREFFWVTIFFLLSSPLLQFAPIGMDHYGLNRIGDFSGTHLAFMLALLINLVVAATAGLMFHLVRVRQDSLGNLEYSALRRAALAVLPPLGFVYAVVAVISNASVWIQLSVLIAAVAGIFITLMVWRDPSCNPSDKERQFIQWAAMAISLVGTTLGVLTVLLVYASPDMPRVLPDHNLLTSWEIDFDELGFTKEEALERVNLGYMWHGTFTLAYMILIVGSNLLAGVYRLSSGKTGEPEADSPGVLASADKEETPRGLTP